MHTNAYTVKNLLKNHEKSQDTQLILRRKRVTCYQEASY